MYAQPYVGARVVKFNVSRHVFVAPLGAGLLRRYTSYPQVSRSW